MPLPVLAWIVIVLVAAGGSAAAGYNWDKIAVFWAGKRLGVLGASGVGKTTLVKFLTEGWIPKEHVETIGAEKTKWKRLDLKGLDIKVKDGKDVGGREDARNKAWKDVVLQSDVVLYLLMAHDLLARDERTLARIESDAAMICSWMDEREKAGKGRARVAIIGTHADLDARFATMKMEDFRELFSKNEHIHHLALQFGGTGSTLVVLGSLKTLDDTQTLVHTLFAELGSR